MKKLFTLVLIMVGGLFLSGCDFLENDQYQSSWYDENTTELHLSYNVGKPSTDSETDEEVLEYYFLMVLDNDTSEWKEYMQLDHYRNDELVIEFNPEQYGDIQLKIETRDEDGTLLRVTDQFHIYVNEPMFIYHFNAWFDSWNGSVHFDYSVNDFHVNKLLIEKSIDGGITWEEVLVEDFIIDETGMTKNDYVYYEYNENSYVYKLTVFNENDEELSSMSTWGEINVSYDDRNFNGDPYIYEVSASYDTFSRNISIWWNAEGSFDKFIIEKSTDNMNWTLLGEVPRIASNFNYIEETDGEYFYRVSAMIDDYAHTDLTNTEAVRVKDGILISYLNGWVEWDTGAINLNWDIHAEETVTVSIERSFNSSEFTLVEEFGGLKHMYIDKNLQPGNYKYQVTIKNVDGEIVDSLVSKEFTIEQPQHVYHLNAWFNQSTGEIDFQFGLNQQYVTHYIIEKSSDGGLTWETYVEKNVELTSDNYYVDNFRVLELVEGAYAYRLKGYDELNNFVGEAYSYNEVVVEYFDLNLDEPTEIYHLDGQFNIYDNSINLWWSSQGNYQKHVIEYSIDGIMWIEHSETPRVATSLFIDDLPNGEYLFRISAVNEDNEVLYTREAENYIRVKENAQIGSFYGYFNWDNNSLNLNWDIIKDNVATIKVERRLLEETEFTLLGEFGNLKTTYIDNLTETGTYIYKLVLLDNQGNIIDELESDYFYIEIYPEME